LAVWHPLAVVAQVELVSFILGSLASYVLYLIQSAGNKITITHALVRIIEDDCTSVIPLVLLTPRPSNTTTSVEEGQFKLFWPENGKIYTAMLIVKGKVIAQYI